MANEVTKTREIVARLRDTKPLGPGNVGVSGNTAKEAADLIESLSPLEAMEVTEGMVEAGLDAFHNAPAGTLNADRMRRAFRAMNAAQPTGSVVR